MHWRFVTFIKRYSMLALVLRNLFHLDGNVPTSTDWRHYPSVGYRRWQEHHASVADGNVTSISARSSECDNLLRCRQGWSWCEDEDVTIRDGFSCCQRQTGNASLAGSSRKHRDSVAAAAAAKIILIRAKGESDEITSEIRQDLASSDTRTYLLTRGYGEQDGARDGRRREEDRNGCVLGRCWRWNSIIIKSILALAVSPVVRCGEQTFHEHACAPNEQARCVGWVWTREKKTMLWVWSMSRRAEPDKVQINSEPRSYVWRIIRILFRSFSVVFSFSITCSTSEIRRFKGTNCSL